MNKKMYKLITMLLTIGLLSSQSMNADTLSDIWSKLSGWKSSFTSFWLSKLTPWEVSAWNEGTDYDEDTYNSVQKSYFYNSPLALNGGIFKVPAPPSGSKIYAPDYRLRNYDTDLLSGTSPGLAGPFEKTGPTSGYEYWGGDSDRGLGTSNYAIFIEDFGGLHISTMEEKIQIKRRNFSAPTIEQDMLLFHIFNVSKQAFGWHAGLIDDNGNKIPYDMSTSKGQLLSLFDYMIYGTGTSDGVLSLDTILNAFESFAGPRTPANAMHVEIDRVRAFVEDLLRTDEADPIPLVSWDRVMSDHQGVLQADGTFKGGLYENFVNYRKYYLSPKAANAQIANMHSRHMLDGGRQLAAFFSVFYSGVVILDIFRTTVLHDTVPSALPTDIDLRMNSIHENLKRFWYEHVHMFDDFAKAAAIGDTKTLYELKISKFESCANLGGALGRVMADLDYQIRAASLLSKLP